MPKAVRDALGLVEGDQVVFRVEGRRALLARTPGLLDLAGSVPVPAQKRGTPSATIRSGTSSPSFDRAVDRVTTVQRIEPS